jgi:transcriptional regulator with GAF, ATPase, and Fis domain
MAPPRGKAISMSSDARCNAFAALTRFLVTDTTLDDTLQRIADITIEAIPSADVAGITMLDGQAQPTAAIYTDRFSSDVDAAQYGSGRGPSLDAWYTHRVVRINDLAESTVYPEFVAVARRHKVLSILSLPLLTGEAASGALNLYARRANGFSAGDEALGVDLAEAAAVVLANITAYWTAFEFGQNLTKAMQTRAGIEQAKGMLMAHAPELSPSGAFDLLREVSQRENVKLRDIAQRVLNREPLNHHGE